MRPLIPLLAVAALVLSTGAAYADCEQLFKLLADDGEQGDAFGWSAAISGTTVIVGTSWDEADFIGSAYLFDLTTREQIAKLLPDDGAAWDWFGISVAISGTTAIVGASGDDDRGDRSGSAYLFDTTTGEQIAKLLADDGAEDDSFGYSVAISGTTAIIGAYHDDDNGDNSGAAYLFDTVTGEQIVKLLPDDGAAWDHFGWSVAISGTTAIVGVPQDDDNGSDSGSAYLFDTITGEQIAKLVPDDGAVGDEFGFSVAISGTTAIVGAYLDDDNGLDAGAAYVFDTATGRQIAKLLPDDGAEDDQFGLSVAISGATAIAGAYRNDDQAPVSGSAYLFDTATGEQVAKLLPDDGAMGDSFGQSVAINGTTAIVGADGDDNENGAGAGSAYVFNCIECRGREKIKRATCRNRNGASRRLLVKLIKGVPGDTFTVELATGETRDGTLDENGKGKARFRRLPSGEGTATARWGCGAEDLKTYSCP